MSQYIYQAKRKATHMPAKCIILPQTNCEPKNEMNGLSSIAGGAWDHLVCCKQYTSQHSTEIPQEELEDNAQPICCLQGVKDAGIH